MTVTIDVDEALLRQLSEDADELRRLLARERETHRATYRLLELEEQFGLWSDVLFDVVDAARRAEVIA